MTARGPVRAGSKRRANETRTPRTRGDGGRMARTIVLAACACAAGMYWLAQEWEIDGRELLVFLGTSAVFIGLVVALSVTVAGLFVLLRKLSARKRKVKSD